MSGTLKLRSLGGCAIAGLAALAAACANSSAPAAEPSTPAATATAPVAPGKIEVSVLSSRYDLVTGGDALVEVKASEGARAGDLKVSIDGQALPQPLTLDASANTLRGLVTGLHDGPNSLQVTGAGGYTVSQPLVNHPITGPVLAGPLISPFECKTKESGLGEPTDDNCSAPTRYDWFYKMKGGDKFMPLADPKSTPADVDMTTTINGKTVPYIVRVESGVIDRSIYRIAVLDDPSANGFSADAGWNGRLALSFGGGCGTAYNQGVNKAENALSDLYLARGFAYVISTEMVNQLNCNGVLQGETAMMLKEHFVKHYGVPKWTVGSGGSGGAIQQLLIAEMYPGVLDGLQPSLAFPDSALHTPDCGLLQHYFKSKEGAKWSADKKAAVTGFYGTTCASWERSFVPITDASNKKGCGLTDISLVYDPKTNPKGARCTVTDLRVNIYGRDPKTGFARKPDDNVGVQYGLATLNQKKISVDEFLSLNENVGGNDIDGNFVKARSVGDPIALKAIYASGLMNSGGGGLKDVPILDYRWYSDTANDIHSRERDLTIRARLERANGRSDNQVIWVAGPRGRPGTPEAANMVDLSALALDAMTKWLDAMAADSAPLSTDKVVRHKPAEATDAYWTKDGKKVEEKASWDGEGGFNQTYPVHSEPRLVAGQPPANDIMKCQLKPVSASDYRVKFTSAQMARLKKIFPDGVCDYQKPGIGQVPLAGAYQKY
ncbi:MAG: hypothetical protein GC155_05265 [Alphaproteobacteria bacterium]|nr:hypothetical protein [Alphaproteobacteria bacterium]